MLKIKIISIFFIAIFLYPVNIHTKGWFEIIKESHQESKKKYEKERLGAEYLQSHRILRTFVKRYPKKADPNFIYETTRRINRLTKNNESLSFYSLLTYMFSSKHFNYAKSQLLSFIDKIKEQDKKNEPISPYKIDEFKDLWNDYLLFHNYSQLDAFLYFCSPHIHNSNEKKYRQTLYVFFHPDRNKHSINKNIKEEMFKHMAEGKKTDDIKRPEKPLDFIVKVICNFGTPLLFQAGFKIGFQASGSLLSLPSILFPNYFKNKKILHLETIMDQKRLNLVQYDIVTSHFPNIIQTYDLKIKQTNLNIEIKKEKIKNILNTLKTRN